LASMKDDIIAPLMTGTSNVSLDINDLYDLEVPLPSIQVQNKIVNSLKKFEDEIHYLNRQIELNESKIFERAKSLWD